LQYTGSVNRFLWNYCLPILALFYVLFLAFDYYHLENNSDGIINKKIKNITEAKGIDGVILGGSNAFFSLSAELLTIDSERKWLNLSLLSEGNSDKNYWLFIQSSLNESQRSKVTDVVYSSVTPLRYEHISDRKRSKLNLLGEKNFIGTLPTKSIGYYLKKIYIDRDLILKKISYPLPNNYGDFDFSSFECQMEDSVIQFERNLNEKDVSDWVNSQLSNLIILFPKSNLYFVVPSEFYGDSLDNNKVNQSDKILRDSVKYFNKINNKKVFFIRQESFSPSSLVCDSPFHASSDGRIWRTHDLVGKMRN